MVGSDIQQIVSLSLRSMAERSGPISPEEWEKALRSVITAPAFTAYGDGEENVDSIAVSYCRMLRKGFIPTAEEELFRREDYHIEYAADYERLKQTPMASMSEEEQRRHQSALREHEILQDRSPVFSDRYDEAIYAYLQVRINEMALPLEKQERQRMMR